MLAPKSHKNRPGRVPRRAWDPESDQPPPGFDFDRFVIDFSSIFRRFVIDFWPMFYRFVIDFRSIFAHPQLLDF